VARPPIEVLEGDARSIPAVPDRSVHLIVTSPPYPKIPQWDALFGSLGATTYPAMHAVLAAAWREGHRVLVDGGLMAINIGDAVRSDDDGFRLWPNHVTVTESAERAGFRPLPYLLWKKPTNKPNAFLGSGFLPPNAYVTLDCEFILLFRKGGLRSFPPHDATRAASRYERVERDAWFSQVWEGIRGVRQHDATGRTAAFPPEIPDRLIRMFSCVGETVLDPFAGSGTTLWAAHRRGRRAIGVERDPARAAALRRRSEEELRGPSPRPEPVPGGRAPRRRRA
jgi:modification methylase